MHTTKPPDCRCSAPSVGYTDEWKCTRCYTSTVKKMGTLRLVRAPTRSTATPNAPIWMQPAYLQGHASEAIERCPYTKGTAQEHLWQAGRASQARAVA